MTSSVPSPGAPTPPDGGRDFRWTPEHEAARQEAVLAVLAERRAQDRKWGIQNHPDGTGPDVVWPFTGPASWVAQCAKQTTDHQEITEAIHRYVVADREIPTDWLTELDEILRRLNARRAAARVRQVGQQQ